MCIRDRHVWLQVRERVEYLGDGLRHARIVQSVVRIQHLTLTDPDDREPERVTGIEPAFSAWEADVLPLNYTRKASERLSPPATRFAT